MKKRILSIIFLGIFSLLFQGQANAQSAEIRPNQGVSVPQFTTTFITAMTTQPKGTVVFDKDLNIMKYWDGTAWQAMSGGSGDSSPWTITGVNINNSNTGNVGIGIANSSTKLGIYGDKNITPIVSNVADNGALTIFTPDPSIFSLGSNFLSFDKNTIQSRFNSLSFPSTLSESNLRLNPFGGRVGIGTAGTSLTATLQVFKSASSLGGTALFKGTTHSSNFHSGSNEDTFIRGGKDGSYVFLNNIPSGNVGIGPVPSTFNSSLLVFKSSNSFDGTAVFKGSTYTSHFSYGTNEDTYIRGGKDGGHIIMNDIPLGNVGIGVVPNTYKLEVNGTIRAKEVIVETGWADYVFAKNYKLKSIYELEDFIKNNKHLPNIPSAYEIESKGLKVGETNKVMMEKIEELALYIIQLKKEIDVLKSKK
jgi:hypothetical protein